ncbi:Uncharacterised protein family (UPF0158) [Marivirga sericea]|uniref:Uncharacterized protein family (UPF0158) n=1 Tax=Marivirga sericea TaxID=1028 RepID=A0A1X7L279_9BACT|nr:UPF0158 family protein [Marivirga sericea]SMG47968.1 Uncharacterised protein family (UPF0158) [Marivirga sericea]
MKISEKHIAEIADLLDMGQVCYVHKQTDELLHHTDPDSLHFDPDQWKDIILSIKKDREAFIKFDPLDSRDSYNVMSNFAHSIKDMSISEKLLDTLARPKPFQNFKHQIQYLNYTDDWHQFKQAAMIDWVRQQIEE